MDEQKQNEFFRAETREEMSTSEYFDFADAVRRAVAGEQAAQEALYEHSASLLEWEVRKEYARPEDVEDLLQESYLRIFKSLSQLKEPDRFLGWALIICKRTVLERKTRKDRVEQLVDYWPETSDVGEPSLDLLPADEDRKDLNPDVHVDAVALSETLETILDALPDIQRMCLLLWMNGYKYQEIAEELGVPLGTVKGNMSRARKKVAEALEEMREAGTFDYNAVSSDPFKAFLSLLQASIANAQTTFGVGDILTSVGKAPVLARRTSTAVLSVLLVLVMAIGLALGIQSRSPEMAAEPAVQQTTRVTRTQAEETTASTTAPGEEDVANNGTGETPVPEPNTVTSRTPAPAGTSAGANARRTNATTAVVQQAAAGNNGPLVAEAININDVTGGPLQNAVAQLSSRIAKNITAQGANIDSEVFPLNDTSDTGMTLYLYINNRLGKPIRLNGISNLHFKSLTGQSLLKTRVIWKEPFIQKDSEEQWFSIYLPYDNVNNRLVWYQLKNNLFQTAYDLDYD